MRAFCWWNWTRSTPSTNQIAFTARTICSPFPIRSADRASGDISHGPGPQRLIMPYRSVCFPVDITSGFSADAANLRTRSYVWFIADAGYLFQLLADGESGVTLTELTYTRSSGWRTSAAHRLPRGYMRG